MNYEKVVRRFETGFCPELNSGCWLWTRSIDGAGYGKIWTRAGYIGAHRFSYEFHFGLIPDGQFICHKCDTPACVNPSHLFMGSSSDNAQDMLRKGRGNKAHSETHACARLTNQEVIEIKDKIASGQCLAEIGRLYSVTRHTIWRIKENKIWKYVIGVPKRNNPLTVPANLVI